MIMPSDVELVEKSGHFEVYDCETLLFSIPLRSDLGATLCGYNIGLALGQRIGEGVAQRRMLRALGLDGQSGF